MMKRLARKLLTENPTLLEFAPLIYVAWSDGALAEEEIARMHAHLGERRLDAEAQKVVEEWLNPQKPPTPSELFQLLELMRNASAGIAPGRFATLTDFGRFLAHRSAQDDAETPELRALREVEAAMGLPGEEALRVILGPLGQAERAASPAAFDSEALARFVDGERYDVRRFMFNVLQRPVFARPAEPIEQYRERVYGWCRELARLGVSAYAYPPVYGGEGNIFKSIAAFETIAYHDLSLLVKFGVQFGLFGGSVLQLGTHKHHAAYLPRIASLDLAGCFAMTETDHGSNVRELETTASFDLRTKEFVINTPHPGARKDYIGNAALHAHMATVFAQLEVNGEQHGVHAFLVPLRDAAGKILPGVAIEDCGLKAGLNGVDNGRVSFDAVRVPRANLLDRFGQVSADGQYSSEIASASRRFFTMLGTLVAGRISIAAAACSVAKLGLTIGTRYAARRRQFGPEGAPEVPILEYRSIQTNLLPLLARTYALDFALYDTVRSLRTSDVDTRELELRAAALKAHSSRHTVATLQYCRELCGGQGYLWENRLAELRADTDVFTTFEGANNVLLLLVARGLVTGLRDQFGELRVWSALKYLRARAGTALTELNPVITRKTDPEHLRDPEFHMSALRYREARLLRSAAARIRSLIADGLDSFQAVNQCQDHLIRLADAYTERLMLECFQQRLAQCSNPGILGLMRPLCTVYALSAIHADRGWFLESGYMESGKVKAIRRLLNEMCQDSSRDAVSYTEPWGIPAAFLPAIVR